MTEYKDNQESKDYGSPRFVALWTALILFGAVLEFFGRLFGYADNPLSIFHPLIPALTGMAAALIILAGYFTVTSKQARQTAMTRRKGVLLITLGATMLVGFFIFKRAIPLIFG
jgi:prepilin signal peptidase PulO-like enzyme (type II secretory pathway)